MITQRYEEFDTESGALRRSVIPRRGDPYVHRCEREMFVAVLHAIDERRGDTFTYEEIRDALSAPASQVAAAVAFLRERSCIVPGGKRRNRAATADAYLDGMIEFLALEARA